MPTTCYHAYQLPCHYNDRKICTRKCIAIVLCVCGLVWISGCQFKASPWANSVHSVMLASRFWRLYTTGGGWDQWRCWILWKSTGSHGWLRDTQGLFDWQPCNANHQAVTSQIHWHYITTHPHSVHTVHTVTLITIFCLKNVFAPCAYALLPALSIEQKQYVFDE